MYKRQALNPGYTRDTLPEFFVSAMELTPEEHADTQCVIQRWIDSSISKTVNAPRGFSVRQVQHIYERLYAGGAKGGTVYVDGSRDSQVPVSYTHLDVYKRQLSSLRPSRQPLD